MEDKFSIVSYPRAGQHLLQDVIKYVCSQHDLEYKFCDFYDCCQTNPCINGANFMKNHDHDLKLPIDNTRKYVALYRNDIILQLEAYYRYYINKKELKYNLQELKPFILSNKKYYLNFRKKWIDNYKSNVIVIEYYDFVDKPSETIRKVFNFLYPDLKLKDEIINDIKNIEFYSHNKKSVIKPQHQLRPFLYNFIKNFIKN